MFCTKCGHELGNGDEFCTKCGAPIKREEPDKADIFSAPQKAATKEGEHSSAKQTGAPRLVKCPHCGENIPSFSAFCPSCGQELRFPNQISSIADLSKRIADIESLRPKKKRRHHFSERISASEYDAQIASLISNYPIPNTREDLLEFAILAHSSIRPKELTEGSASQQAINAAWMSKLEQANNKAALAMPSSQEAERISSLFQQINQKIEKEQRRRRRSPLLLLVNFAIWGALVLFFSLMPEKTTEQKISSQNSHLEYIVEQVNDDIADGLFDRARNKAYSISFDESLSPECHGYWEKQKEELLNRIQEAQEASDVKHQKLLDEVGSKTSN